MTGDPFENLSWDKNNGQLCNGNLQLRGTLGESSNHNLLPPNYPSPFFDSSLILSSKRIQVFVDWPSRYVSKVHVKTLPETNRSNSKSSLKAIRSDWRRSGFEWKINLPILRRILLLVVGRLFLFHPFQAIMFQIQIHKAWFIILEISKTQNSLQKKKQTKTQHKQN